ncbi:MAG TPA: hypothetical protein VJN96_21915 [Vicinamibacterales bacterium]|nr:hypothetical protein [Vicinamibacterales bacterium]
MPLLRAVIFVALGATAFTAAPGLVSRLQPPLTIDFSTDPPSKLSAGFYPAEHTEAGMWFAWTHGAFGLAFPTLDRSTPWTITLKLSGSRPDGTTPELITNVDGVVRDRTTLPAAGFIDRKIKVDALPGGGRGLTVAWTVTPTFVPGPGDNRALGAQIDSIELAPAGPGPRVALDLRPLVLVGVVVGAALGALALPWIAGTSLIVLMAVATAFIMTRGLGPFVTFPWLPIALGAFASAMVTTVALPARTTGGRLVVAITFMTVGLQLLLLTHPDMPINDAIFQTHRFQDVLGGQYLFASLAPGNYRFPYPIGLYLFARPFATFAPTTLDRMMLLRVIVVAVDACAAALLYRLVMRWRKDEVEAVSSVVAYHLLPLGFGVIVTANLTNVFAQSLATVTLVVAGLAVADLAAGWAVTVAIGAIAAAAFLSHTSTFAVLGTQLVVAGGALAIARDRAWRPSGRMLVIAAVGALVFSIAVYYAYFMDVYREAFGRIASETGHATAAAGGRTPLTRLVELPQGLNVTFGVAGIAMALVGAATLWTRPNASPVRKLIGMWLLVCLFFMVVGIVTPVDLRHLLAALPVIGILIGIGFAAGWRSGPAGRALGVAAAAWMLWICAISWTGALGH